MRGEFFFSIISPKKEVYTVYSLVLSLVYNKNLFMLYISLLFKFKKTKKLPKKLEASYILLYWLFYSKKTFTFDMDLKIFIFFFFLLFILLVLLNILMMMME